VIEAIRDREEKKFKELKEKTREGKCVISKCDRKGETYRWLRVALENGGAEHQEHILCIEHAKQHDNGNLPEDTTIRSVV